MEGKIDDILKHSMDFLHEFDRKMDQCEDGVEYCALVASLFVFEEFVLSNFKSQFLLDGTPREFEVFLDVLRKEAKPIAEPIIKNWNKENLH